ncbi:MAG: sensor domain-containing diguanylate cyclase [Candidatus Omnitrophota bacterium]
MYNFATLTNLLLFIIVATWFLIAGKIPSFIFLIFLGTLFFIFFLFRALKSRHSSRSKGELDRLEENLNLLTDAVNTKKKLLEALPLKYEKIASLFKVSHDLIELTEPQTIYTFLVNTLERLFPQAESIIIFSLKKDSLSLTFSSKKEKTPIKEKHGDIIEKWVLKQNQSLAIDDIARDFRFDYNKVNAFRERKMRSFLVSPLSVGDNALGVVRVESRNVSSFSVDDSRLLRSICDFAAVVLERANFIENAKDLAAKDSLTALYVRDYFFNRLREELKRATLKNSNLGLIMLDIDDFKRINDIHGHIVGDAVLKKLASILVQIAGDAGNAICRFGGEEFVIFIVECKKEQLIAAAEKIRSSVEQVQLMFRRKNITFTVSLGLAFYPEDGNDAITLLDKADHMLYRAKKTGKNKLCYMGQ